MSKTTKAELAAEIVTLQHTVERQAELITKYDNDSQRRAAEELERKNQPPTFGDIIRALADLADSLEAQKCQCTCETPIVGSTVSFAGFDPAVAAREFDKILNDLNKTAPHRKGL